MSISDEARPVEEVAEGYVAVPVSAEQLGSPLRVCVALRPEPDPVAGHLVVLRDTIDARVLLGCIADAAGAVHQWVEIWVQSLDALVSTVAACREALSNRILDERWLRHVRALEELGATSLVRTGAETEHPLPAFIHVADRRPVHPTDPTTGAPWTLCRDDALLAEAGLPPYSTSLHRYLSLGEVPGERRFVPVTPEAPANDHTLALADMLREHGDLVPLNPGGGLMLVREFCPVDYESFSDLLSGGSWDGVLHGRSPVGLGADYEELATARPGEAVGGRLFLGAHGRWGRLVESFHLKLRLLADAVAAVRALSDAHQRPLLNLCAESFRVKIGTPGEGLPFLWGARAVLADPGDAIAPQVTAGDTRYFLRAGAGDMSVYRPASAGAAVRGRGTVRIRQVLPGTRGQTLVEGTFVTQERVEAGRRDLLWLRLNVADRRLDVYAYLESEAALATGEWRFRSVGQAFTEAEAEALRAAEGVPMNNTAFEIVPLLSTPCDLYSLAVLAVRTLLVDGATTLPVALDEMLSLARQVAVDAGEGAELRERIEKVFDSDERWVASLGPQRLTREDVEARDAFDVVPADLWWDTLAAIVRMFPAMGPDSACRDYGDAP
ncbi:hypothetical protein HQ560_06280, partial [bacterium]|nr:hypothetical protein [bacterium]